MSMEQPWNDINKGRPNYSKPNLSQCWSQRQNLTWNALKQNMSLVLKMHLTKPEIRRRFSGK